MTPCTIDDATIDDVAAGTINNIGPMTPGRYQDLYKTHEGVRTIALNEEVMNVLGGLRNREAFPFATLNFVMGTGQPVHSDVVHFDSFPQRGLMAAAWLALEDVVAVS